MRGAVSVPSALTRILSKYVKTRVGSTSSRSIRFFREEAFNQRDAKLAAAALLKGLSFDAPYVRLANQSSPTRPTKLSARNRGIPARLACKIRPCPFIRVIDQN